MEEIFLAVAQFLIEILFPLLVELFINLIARTWRPTGTKSDSYFFLILIAGFLGSISGFCPSPLGNHPVVQAAAVIFGPWILAKLVEKKAQSENSEPTFGTFWEVYWFTFSFLLTRSIVIHHKSIRIW